MITPYLFYLHLQVFFISIMISSQVDGNTNHRIESMRFPCFPISCAQFLKDAKKFVVGSNDYNHIYVCDMETLRETKLCIHRKSEKSVAKVSFSRYQHAQYSLLVFST